jgi:prepilin-type N-terminal cleavage/methylation domain-containing protein
MIGRRMGCQGGFTLMELLVALGIATVVCAAAYAALDGALRVYVRSGDVMQRVQVTRAVAEKVSRELRGVVFRPQTAEFVFLGEAVEDTDTGLGARLEFVTAAGKPPMERVTYFLRDEDSETGRPAGLYRLSEGLLDLRTDDVEYEEVPDDSQAVLVAPEVVGFEAEYYDTQSELATSSLGLRQSLTGEDAWETSWDGQTEGRLPGAVALTFRMGKRGKASAGSQAEVVEDGRPLTLVVLLPTSAATEAEGEEAGGALQE